MYVDDRICVVYQIIERKRKTENDMDEGGGRGHERARAGEGGCIGPRKVEAYVMVSDRLTPAEAGKTAFKTIDDDDDQQKV